MNFSQSDSLNSVYDSYITDQINEQLNNCEEQLDRELIKPIPLTNCYTNSVNIAVGRQRTGKTYSIIKEIIKISNVHPETHLLIYVNQTGRKGDDTMEAMKTLIKCPVIYVSESEFIPTIQNIMRWKELYNTIKDEGIENEIVDEQRDELFEVLRINDFNRQWLHTLILLEDCAKSKLLTNEKSFTNQLLTKCGHIQCSFFLAVQYWKALNSNIKANASTIFIFAGFSRQQLSFILYQTNIPYSMNEIYERYKELKGHEKMIADSYGGNLTFTK